MSIGGLERIGQKSRGREPSVKIPRIDLTPLPLAGVRDDWVDWINAPQTAEEEQAILHAIGHGPPFGGPEWSRRMEKQLGLGPLRHRGRPLKTPHPVGIPKTRKKR